MAELTRIERRSIVMLKVALGAAEDAVNRMHLAAPLKAVEGDPASYWYGPDCWYLSSETETATEIVEECRGKLDGVLYNAVDYSASLAKFRLSGDGAREVLASGTGIDLRQSKLAARTCMQTRLAGILAMITVIGDSDFEIFVDRSYANYFEKWLSDTASIVLLTKAG